MTLILVKYGASDYRLHRDDATELGAFDERADIAMMRSTCHTANGGPQSIHTNARALKDDTCLLTGDWVYRDVAEHGPDEIPFDVPDDVTLSDGGPQRSD